METQRPKLAFMEGANEGAGRDVGDLGLKSTSAALKDLLDNLAVLNRTRNHVQMGNLKFESLCHAIATSVRDAASLMAAAAATEHSAAMRQRSLEARKLLLECAAGIVENAGHPFKVRLTFPDRISHQRDSIYDVCIRGGQ